MAGKFNGRNPGKYNHSDLDGQKTFVISLANGGYPQPRTSNFILLRKIY